MRLPTTIPLSWRIVYGVSYHNTTKVWSTIFSPYRNENIRSKTGTICGATLESAKMKYSEKITFKHKCFRVIILLPIPSGNGWWHFEIPAPCCKILSWKSYDKHKNTVLRNEHRIGLHLRVPKGEVWWRYWTYFNGWKRELDEKIALLRDRVKPV